MLDAARLASDRTNASGQRRIEGMRIGTDAAKTALQLKHQKGAQQQKKGPKE